MKTTMTFNDLTADEAECLANAHENAMKIEKIKDLIKYHVGEGNLYQLIKEALK